MTHPDPLPLQGTLRRPSALRVFVHVDAEGTYLGNGGCNVLVSLAQEIARLGYRTSVFDHMDRLDHSRFSWLCWDELLFDVAPVDNVFSQRSDSCVIITSWLHVLAPFFSRRSTAIRMLSKLGKGITPANIRYWCLSELIRFRYSDTKDFCLKHCKKIAISNRSLEHYYREFGFRNIIALEEWFRSDLFYFDGDKIPNSIGTQPDWLVGQRSELDYAVYHHLRSLFGDARVNLCVGNQKDVASAMRKSDFYVFFNHPSPDISLFRGETLGRSLFEAMACGCVCVAVEHEDNKFLRGVIPLVTDMAEIAPIIETLIRNPQRKEEIRARSMEVIESRFRFDDNRRRAISRLLA